MKNHLKIALIIVAALFLTVSIPHKTEAKDIYSYKVISTLPQTKWVSTKGYKAFHDIDNHYNYNLYNISIPTNGYITIQSDSDSRLDILSEINKNKAPYEYNYQGIWDSNVHRLVLSKGDYYIVPYYDQKIRWSFEKVSDSGNYCRAKSKKIARNKKETIVIADGYEYPRWYKVLLTKKKTLTVNLKCLDDGIMASNAFDVFDNKGKRIECPTLVEQKSYRTATLKKGTYYIKVSDGLSYAGNSGYKDNRIFELSWK